MTFNRLYSQALGSGLDTRKLGMWNWIGYRVKCGIKFICTIMYRPNKSIGKP